MAKRKKKKKGARKKDSDNETDVKQGEKKGKPGKRTREEIAKRIAENQFPVPESAEDERRKGNKEYHRRNHAQAVVHYTRGIAYSSRNPSFLVVLFANRAAAHIGLKAYDQCIDDCSAAITLDQNSVKAHGRRAYAYYCMKRYAEAVRDYEIALKLDPDNSQVKDNLLRASSSLAAQREKEKSQAKAAGDSTKVEAAKPKPDVKKPEASPAKQQHLPAYEDLPPLIPCEYRFDEVTQEFDSDNVPLSNRARATREKELGNSAVSAGNYQLALKHYTNAINLNSLEAVFYSNRALVHLKLERYFDAIHDCSKSIELKASIKAHARRGTAWMSLHQYEKAADDFECALRFERRNHECLTGLEKCLMIIEAQCVTKAREDDYQDKHMLMLETTRQRFQKWGFPLKNTSDATHAPGEPLPPPTEPSQEPAAAAPPAPVEGEAPLPLEVRDANMLVSPDDLQNIVRVHSRVIAKEPHNSVSYLRRGEAYLMQGRVKQAVDDFRSGLRYDPDNMDLQRQLKAARRLAP